MLLKPLHHMADSYLAAIICVFYRSYPERTFCIHENATINRNILIVLLYRIVLQDVCYSARFVSLSPMTGDGQ